MTIAYRPAEIDDARFVVSAWSRTYKGSRQAGVIASEDWERIYHPQIQKVLSRPDARTIVAYENTDPTFLYGFISGDTSERIPVIFFCYVKGAFRRAGYARGLFAALGVNPVDSFQFTHWTPTLAKLKTKIPYARHDPNLARYPKEHRYGHDEDPR